MTCPVNRLKLTENGEDSESTSGAANTLTESDNRSVKGKSETECDLRKVENGYIDQLSDQPLQTQSNTEVLSTEGEQVTHLSR